MAKPAKHIHDLLDALELPPGTAAQLDWVTGSMRINKTVAQWRHFHHNKASDIELIVTLNHEIHHFVQLSMFSYLFRFVQLTNAIIAGLVDTHYNDLSKLPDALGANERLFRDSVWDLTWRDDGRLSVVDIVESLTYFVQQNSLKSWPEEEYRQHLADVVVPDVYKLGYTRFVGRAGSANYKLFPITCGLSLCSMDPRACFDEMTGAIGEGKINYRSTMPDMVAYCRSVDPGFVGFSWEWQKTLGEAANMLHPVYGPLLRILEGDQVSATKYLFSPATELDDRYFQLALAGGTILNPTADTTAAGFREWQVETAHWGNLSAEAKRKRGLKLLYMTGAARKYIGAIGQPPAGVVKHA